MKIRLHILFMLLALAACHSPQRQAEPCPQEDMLYQVEGFFPKKPDSALQILDTLNVSVLSEMEQAHYSLLKVKVRDRFFLYDNETDSLMQVAENYFIGRKDKYFESETYECLSRIAFKEGKGEQVKLECLQKALQSIENCRHIDERLVRFSLNPVTEKEMIDVKKYFLHMKLGMCYLDNDYQEESLGHLRKAEKYYSTKEYNVMHFQTAFMLGNAYLSLKEYDSCLFYFGKGLQAAQEANNAERIAYYHFSKAMYYRCRFDYQDYETEEEGQQLLWNAIAECHQGLALYEGPMFRYKDGLFTEMNKCFYQLEQYDSCIYYAERQIDFLNDMHFEIVPNPENAGVFFRLHKSYAALENKEKALECADRYFEMQQAIEKQPKAVEQVKNEYEKKLEMTQLHNEQRMKRYRLYLLLALALVALVVVLWLSNRYRKNKEIEALRQEEAYHKLRAELESASQQALQALQQRVMELYRSGEGNSREHILAEFAAAYPQGMEKLQANHPGLGETERHIVVLSFLGFRVKEVAEILDLSTNTVVKYRSNIRKKVDAKAFSDLIR